MDTPKSTSKGGFFYFRGVKAKKASTSGVFGKSMEFFTLEINDFISPILLTI
jgi:hypothetical protein